MFRRLTPGLILSTDQSFGERIRAAFAAGEALYNESAKSVSKLLTKPEASGGIDFILSWQH